ncbi:ribonuclease Y-like [Montipora capricornis]|uniref:ribonuclease Y-like n=1 Tax=Montipora capricornis TaxID=246305 RepID=UPI0035F1E7FB
MVKRSLFDTSTLDQLDRATGSKEEDKMEVTISQEVNLSAEATDLEEMRRQKQELEKSLEAIKADYQAEVERLELENRQLKARALKEKEEREKYQELVKKRESEINELEEALKVTKEQSSTSHAAVAASIKVASEMMNITVIPAEFGNQELVVSRRDKNKCPLCRRTQDGDWQQCTIKQCGQWVHCRCEAKLDTSYRCPHCRKQDTGEAQ